MDDHRLPCRRAGARIGADRCTRTAGHCGGGARRGGGTLGPAPIFAADDTFRVENVTGDEILGIVDQQRALTAETQIEDNLEEVRPHVVTAEAC